MLEAGFLGLEAIASPEVILADPGLAPNFADARILADPMGILLPLQALVKRDFARSDWVLARCEAELRVARGAIDSIESSTGLVDNMFALWEILSRLTGLVALASLQPPTHRRSLIVSEEIFHRCQREDLHELVLQLWGSADLTRPQVQSLLNSALPVFDLAVAIHKTPVPIDFKLQPHLRPYFLDASQEMIDEGHHREATFWIALPTVISSLAVMADGSEEEKMAANGLTQDFFGCLGIHSHEDVNARVPMARSLAKTLEVFAREMIRDRESR
jgi:hypothetical protein